MKSQSPSDEEIRNRAYQLFLERGGTEGSPIEDWIRAEQELRTGTQAGSVGAMLETLITSNSKAKGQDADVSDAPESGTRREAPVVAAAGLTEEPVTNGAAAKKRASSRRTTKGA